MFIIILQLLFSQVLSEEERIHIQVNNIAPYSNPIETYRYYMLPFCSPKNLFAGEQTFGQALSGDRKTNSLYNFTIKENTTQVQVCNKSISQNDLHQFRDVIRQNYIAEFDVGDFRLHDIIGKMEDGKILLKKHILFCLYLSRDMKEVYHVNISSPVQTDFVDISNDLESIEFKFSTLIVQIDNIQQLTQGDYLEFINCQSNINWSSITLKCILILIMITFVCWTLRRALKRDFIRLPDEENDWNEVVGWKMIRLEALHPPKNKMLLAAVLGTGIQFLFITVIEISLGVVGLYYGHKGTIKTTGIITYAFTGYFNGYFSGKYYKFFGGKNWTMNIVIAIALFPGSMLSTWFMINSLAWYMDSTAAFPLQTIFFIAFLWAVIYIPMTAIGGIQGRLRTIDQMPNTNSKIKKILKQTPEQTWFQTSYILRFNSPLVQFAVSGILPLISVQYEVDQIFQAAWGHYNFHLYSMILITFVQTLIVIACISIVMTYNQLNLQDYRWWWSSFINSASAGAFLFSYSIYFYLFGSQMHGLIQVNLELYQTSYYFGYSFVSAVVVSLMFGSVGFIATFRFVFYIYGSSKGE